MKNNIDITIKYLIEYKLMVFDISILSISVRIFIIIFEIKTIGTTNESDLSPEFTLLFDDI